MQNPWHRLASVEAHRNPYFRVRHDRVLRPDGQQGDYYVVEAAANASAVAIDADGAVVLVGEWAYPVETYSWCLPSGGSRPNESPLAAAQRELREETGFTAARWQPLGTFYLSQGSSDERGHVFLATGLHAGPATPDPGEQIQIARVPLEEAWRRCCNGEIRDSVTLVGLAWARERLVRRA